MKERLKLQVLVGRSIFLGSVSAEEIGRFILDNWAALKNEFDRCGLEKEEERVTLVRGIYGKRHAVNASGHIIGHQG